ncbi:hypothetical protein C1864_15305, partial [Eggerthella lenta]
SVVMTAASVQAKAAQTHVDLQQKEYAMQSAAKLMAQQLGGEDVLRALFGPEILADHRTQAIRIDTRLTCGIVGDFNDYRF